MAWKHVHGYGLPSSDGEYFVAYRGQYTGNWTIVTAEFEGGKFDCDHSPPYVEFWMEIPELPGPGRR